MVTSDKTTLSLNISGEKCPVVAVICNTPLFCLINYSLHLFLEVLCKYSEERCTTLILKAQMHKRKEGEAFLQEHTSMNDAVTGEHGR